MYNNDVDDDNMDNDDVNDDDADNDGTFLLFHHLHTWQIQSSACGQ